MPSSRRQPVVDDPLLFLLHRAAVVTVALATVTVFYEFGLVKLLRKANEWTQAAARLVPLLVLLTGVTGILMIGDEALLFFQRGGPMSAQGATLGTMSPEMSKPRRDGHMLSEDDRNHAAVIIENQPAHCIQHKTTGFQPRKG